MILITLNSMHFDGRELRDLSKKTNKKKIKTTKNQDIPKPKKPATNNPNETQSH